MTAPRRPPTGSQARAERSRATVIDETVRYVIQEGFAPPSIRRITDRAGLTWGVVQYHFGDLDGILKAVVDKGFEELLETLEALPPTSVSGVEERIAFVVERIWEAFSSPTSMAALEILIATRGARGTEVNSHLAAMMDRFTEIGRQLGEGLSAPQGGRIGNLIWATLRGLVAAQMVWPTPLDSSVDRQTLVHVLAAYVNAAQRDQDPTEDETR